MATVSLPSQRSLDLPKLISIAGNDFRSRANARREILWSIGRLMLIAAFFGVYFADPGGAADFAVAMGVNAAGVTVSVGTIIMVRRGHVFPAFVIGVTNDLVILLLAWTGLLWFGPEGMSNSDGWLSLFPVLISLPYRLGTFPGIVAGALILAWIGALHYAFLPSNALMLEHLPHRWAILATTLLITAAFNYALTRRTEALAEQTTRAERLRDQSEAKSEFIDTISHELRTPITVVLALMRRLMRNSSQNLSERDVEHLKIAMRNANHLSDLIADLLQVTQIERGNFEYKKTSFSVDEFVREAIEDVRSLAGERGMSIRFAPAATAGTLISDRSSLNQVMSNLLTNACKYGDADSEINVATAVEHDRICIEVTNRSHGLAPNDLANLFEMFYRGHNESTRSTSGTGLGLHICRRIVTDLGGEINASMDGDVFTMKFGIPR